MTHFREAMYIYIVDRTQIYLTRGQAAALDREARRTGTTRSHLIREAIAERYGVQPNDEQVAAALRATAGLWRDMAVTGEEYVAELRSGRRLGGGVPETETDPDASAG